MTWPVRPFDQGVRPLCHTEVRRLPRSYWDLTHVDCVGDGDCISFPYETRDIERYARLPYVAIVHVAILRCPWLGRQKNTN